MVYQRWPELRTLVFFIYDPEGQLPDPDNLSGDLSKPVVLDDKEFSVEVILSPRH